MAMMFNETEIVGLLEEIKQVDVTVDDLILNMRDKKAHKENDVSILRPDGSYFKVILRQNKLNPLDFSAILGFMQKGSSTTIRLCRYNGKSHEHRNKIEREQFYDFHIHTATERYQSVGFKEESFAKTTNRYSNLRGAVECLAQDCNIIFNESKQIKLF